MLIMPTGAEVDLCTTNLTHLRACIRDACRRAILKDLITRINGNNHKLKRQDMQGVTANVDLDATTSAVHTKRKCEHVQNPKQFLDKDETGKLHLPIDKPCILDAKSARRHQTIIAGSIQSTHRLKHTRGISTDLCPCAECQGVRCDTLHIFWKCPRWKAVRDPYLQAIERFLNKLKSMPHHLGTARHKAIKKLIDTPCLQLCGICPDAELGTSAYNISVPNPHREAVTQDQMYYGNEQAEFKDFHGV